jgi:hypothetical protein
MRWIVNPHTNIRVHSHLVGTRDIPCGTPHPNAVHYVTPPTVCARITSQARDALRHKGFGVRAAAVKVLALQRYWHCERCGGAHAGVGVSRHQTPSVGTSRGGYWYITRGLVGTRPTALHHECTHLRAPSPAACAPPRAPPRACVYVSVYVVHRPWSLVGRGDVGLGRGCGAGVGGCARWHAER